MGKEKHQSLKKRMIVIWTYVFVSIMLVTTFYGAYIFNLSAKEDKKYIQYKNQYYIENINRDVNDLIRTINAIYQNNVEFMKLSRHQLSSFEWMDAAFTLNSFLAMKTRAINFSAGMYFYDSGKDALRSTYNASMNVGDKFLLDQELRKYIKMKSGQIHNTGYFHVNDKTYIYYVLEKSGIFAGFVIDLAEYIKKFTGMQVIYLWEDRVIINAGDEILNAPVNTSWNEVNKQSHIWNSFQLNICKPLIKNMPIDMVLIQKYNSYWMFLKQPGTICSIIFIPLILVILILYILHVFNQTLLYPVELLLAHTKQLETDGHTIKRPDTIPIQRTCFQKKNESGHVRKMKLTRQNPGEYKTNIEEYIQLNEAIETQLCKLDELREQKYQEEQNAYWARLQYYKLQINPHFYLNCLNTISMLIENNNPHAANGMIRDLSSHFRYVFQDQRQFVSLGEELEEIRALCNIYSLRAGMPILLNEQVNDKYLKIKIPPLTLQTFVENSIKHRDDSGKVLNIIIRHEQLADRTKIYVIDNGNGFSETDLEKYNKPIEKFIYKSDHVGIDNFKFRMKLLYRDKASFAFYNNPAGGAVSEITIWEKLL